MELKDFFKIHPRCALGFSGGTDSAYLLVEGKRLGADIKPYFARSAFQPAFELADAERLCIELKCELTVLSCDVLSCDGIRANGPERCCYCKRELFSAIKARAAEDGYDTVIDGTNASDDISDRPGWRAIRELGVLSPLRDCGVEKAEVRARSAELGLFTANKPAYACLATRIPTGMAISAADLERVERGEAALAALGYSDFRVRLTREGFARLELREADISRAAEDRNAIISALKDDFKRITLDLQGRQG